jgi:hypothetical protein
MLLTLWSFVLFVNTSSSVKWQSALSFHGQIFCGQSGIGTGFLQEYRVSPVIIPPVLRIHSCITDTI